VVETAEKQAAFRIARAALAKSGTVTLELALAGVPMVAAYKVSAIEYYAVGRGILKRLPSIILANLLLGENVVPELLQYNCTSEQLADALLPLLRHTAAAAPDRRVFRSMCIMESAKHARCAPPMLCSPRRSRPAIRLKTRVSVFDRRRARARHRDRSLASPTAGSQANCAPAAAKRADSRSHPAGSEPDAVRVWW
jgi:hypothetical protein